MEILSEIGGFIIFFGIFFVLCSPYILLIHVVEKGYEIEDQLDEIEMNSVKYLKKCNWSIIKAEDFSSYTKLNLSIFERRNKVLLFKKESLIYSTDNLTDMCLYLYNNKMI